MGKIIKMCICKQKNNREGIKSIAEASQNILTGQSMAVFPEGDLTWIKEPNSLVSEFRSGALKIAYKAKCPIVPLVIKIQKILMKDTNLLVKLTLFLLKSNF